MFQVIDATGTELEIYNCGTIRERRRSHELDRAAKHGTIEGTSLGGATKRCGNIPHLNVHEVEGFDY
jgi:hypothetical protein